MEEKMRGNVLAINPGSTSTKVSLFNDEQEVFTENITHKIEELSRYHRATDQDLYRMELVVRILREKEVDLFRIKAVVGRGGLIYPVHGGTYLVNDQMIADLRKGVMGDHPSNCGGLIAYAISRSLGCEAYIVDPVVVDEMEPIAKVSGMPLIKRKSIFHALNQRAIARDIANNLKKPYEELNIIVAHLGGGISVGIHVRGRVVDVNNALDGDGPFSAERCGSVPVGDLIQVCYSGEYTMDEMKKLIQGHGGMVAYLGTQDMRTVEAEIEKGKSEPKLVYEAMAYQVAKEIGALATVVNGKVDAIAITGGMANSKNFVKIIKDRVGFIAPVHVVPGEQEMRALAMGALRVLRHEEKVKIYRHHN